MKHIDQLKNKFKKAQKKYKDYDAKYPAEKMEKLGSNWMKVHCTKSELGGVMLDAYEAYRQAIADLE